jgi:RNA polymerase sigma factor (sigma-70 family)
MSPRGFPRVPGVHSDQRLIALARDGDERAFEALVRRYRRPLLRYCRRMGLSDSRAEDVVQQALLRAWMALERGPEIRAPKAWLYRTVHNTAVNAIRSERDHGPLEDGASVEFAASAESDFERRIDVRQTLNDVAALPHMQRDAILLTAIDGRSHEEVASALGVTHGAVRGLLYRARATLRDAAAAVVPAPVFLWASGLLARITPTAGRLAEVSAPAGNADVASVLAKGAALAATAAVLAVGAGIVPLPRHLAHRSKAAVLALGIAPVTADAQASESSATSGPAGTLPQRKSRPGSRASQRLGGPTSRPRSTEPADRRAKTGAYGVEQGEMRLQQGPLSGSGRSSSDAEAALDGEDGPSAAPSGSSPSGSGSDGTQAAPSRSADRPHGAQGGSKCDRCSEGSTRSAADEWASHATGTEPSQAVPTGAPAAGSGEAAAERHARD